MRNEQQPRFSKSVTLYGLHMQLLVSIFISRRTIQVNDQTSQRRMGTTYSRCSYKHAAKILSLFQKKIENERQVVKYPLPKVSIISP